MGDPAEILAKLLGGPVKLYVTRCSLLELQGLGGDFSGMINVQCFPASLISKSLHRRNGLSVLEYLRSAIWGRSHIWSCQKNRIASFLRA